MNVSRAVRRTLIVLLCVVLIIALWGVGQKFLVEPGVQPSRPPEATSEAVLEVVDRTTLSVPETLRMEGRSFEADVEETYLLQFEATTTKPTNSAGDAMYFGASLACGGPNGGTLRSVGGTQNVRSSEQVTISNQFLLRIEESGSHTCRLSLNSPNEDAVAAGTEAVVDTRWTATRVEGFAVEASADEQLPRAIDPGEKATAFSVSVDVEDFPKREIDVLGTLHVTTCTGTNGSREDGRTWCEEEGVDLDGSGVEVTYHTDVLDASGEVCASAVGSRTRARIVRFTHHRMLHVAQPFREPLSTCRSSARMVVTVQNAGPAPVVVHRSTSTLVVLPNA